MKNKSKKLVPYSVILAATKGDPDAMRKILAHYDGLIEFHSHRTLYDEYGNPRAAIDVDIKQRIQTRIIEKIIYDFDPYRMPPGEVLED